MLLRCYWKGRLCVIYKFTCANEENVYTLNAFKFNSALNYFENDFNKSCNIAHPLHSLSHVSVNEQLLVSCRQSKNFVLFDVSLPKFTPTRKYHSDSASVFIPILQNAGDRGLLLIGKEIETCTIRGVSISDEFPSQINSSCEVLAYWQDKRGTLACFASVTGLFAAILRINATNKIEAIPVPSACLIPSHYNSILTAVFIVDAKIQVNSIRDCEVVIATSKSQVLYVVNSKVQKIVDIKSLNNKVTSLAAFENSFGELIAVLQTEDNDVHVVNLTAAKYLQCFSSSNGVVGDFLCKGCCQLLVLSEDYDVEASSVDQFFLSDFASLTYDKRAELMETDAAVNSCSSVITSALFKRIHFSFADLVNAHCIYASKLSFWRKAVVNLQNWSQGNINTKGKKEAEENSSISTSQNVCKVVDEPWYFVVKDSVVFGVKLLSTATTLIYPKLVVTPLNQHVKAFHQNQHSFAPSNNAASSHCDSTKAAGDTRPTLETFTTCTLMRQGEMVLFTAECKLSDLHLGCTSQLHQLSVMADIAVNDGCQGDGDSKLWRHKQASVIIPLETVSLSLDEIIASPNRLLNFSFDIPASLESVHRRLACMLSLTQCTSLQLKSNMLPLTQVTTALAEDLGLQYDHTMALFIMANRDHPLALVHVQMILDSPTSVKCNIWTWNQQQQRLMLLCLYKHLPDDAVITGQFTKYKTLRTKLETETLSAKQALNLLLKEQNTAAVDPFESTVDVMHSRSDSDSVLKKIILQR